MEAEQQEREEDLFINSNIIKVVKQYKHLRTEEESKRAVGAVDEEVKKRIGMMYTAYNNFDKVTFSNKHLRLKEKKKCLCVWWFRRDNVPVLVGIWMLNNWTSLIVKLGDYWGDCLISNDGII